MIVAVY